ncbi:MAG: hypothetical protein ACEPO2_03115 [Pelagibaca sp.]
MAHAISTTDFHPKATVFKHIADWVSTRMQKIGANNPRLRRARMLQAMSDRQLSALAIKRTDIVHLVFRDAYYR